MSDDLPVRLRTWATLETIEARPVLNHDLCDAADELVRLRAENERLQAALAASGWLARRCALYADEPAERYSDERHS